MGFLLDGRTDRLSATSAADSLVPNHSVTIDRVVRIDNPTPQGLSSYRDIPAFGLLQHAAEQIPEREAILYGDQSWSYAALNRDVLRAAAMLQRLGVRPGDRVGILLPNVPEYIIAANAIWRCGAIAIAISPLMVAEEVTALLTANELSPRDLPGHAFAFADGRGRPSGAIALGLDSTTPAIALPAWLSLGSSHANGVVDTSHRPIPVVGSGKRSSKPNEVGNRFRLPRRPIPLTSCQRAGRPELRRRSR